jgi:mevalonate pyrophosphate decarboxylase
MGEGTDRVVGAVHPERRPESASRGTTRAVTTDGVGGDRVRALGHEITEVRERLDTLMDELDRRRHAALDWRGRVRRHALGLGMSALGLAALASAGAALRATGLSASRMRRRFRRG